jgi:hypothetical protein
MMLDPGTVQLRAEVIDLQSRRPPENHITVGGHVFEESLAQKLFSLNIEDF